MKAKKPAIIPQVRVPINGQAYSGTLRVVIDGYTQPKLKKINRVRLMYLAGTMATSADFDNSGTAEIKLSAVEPGTYAIEFQSGNGIWYDWLAAPKKLATIIVK